MKTFKFISNSVVAQIDEDGKSRISCSIQNSDYLSWLAAGGVPLPADIPNPNDAINAQLNALESKPPVSRFPREHMIATDKAIAAIMEKLDPTVIAIQLLATNSGHQKLLAVDAQARTLRAQLK